ncbi:MAG TPA: YggS family pyridoxal phosphate-dependent enzyme, partial [Myxococcales bacterium]|nr:YggS family pyridoxal phosphate-dependent enzyme [Myxococcales bacterium]
EQAAQEADRDPSHITLLAASKRRTTFEIQEAANAGVSCFGENYVPDLLSKALELPNLEWHFIGHLQRNKCAKLVPHIALLHSLDSVRLANTLNSLVDGLKVLIQVNLGGESTKSGCALENAPELARHLTRECPGLALDGFMCIPPPRVDPTPFYKQLARLRDTVQDSLGMALPSLSMGMSADLEQAVHCGATIVRVGSAIFGERKT